MSETIRLVFPTNAEEIESKLGRLRSKTGWVAAHAANDAGKVAIRAVAQETVKVYDIRQKDVTESLKKKGYATAARPYVRLIYDGVHKNLLDLRSSRSGNSLVSPRREVIGDSPKWIRARVMKGHSMKPLKRRARPFVRTATTGHQAVFVRTADIPGLDDIRGVSGPAVPQEIKNEDVQARFTKRINETLEKRAEHYIDQLWKNSAWTRG